MPQGIEFMKVYLQDQARPIGSGWRWLFVRRGPKWVRLLDPWNRYTVRIPLKSRGDTKKGWQGVGIELVERETTKAVLAAAKRTLRRLGRPLPLTKFEEECLSWRMS